MYNNNLPIQRKKSVISFDTVISDGRSIQVPTIYSALNTLYSNEQTRRLPNTIMDVFNRRAALEAMFSNRVLFLVQNAILNAGSRWYHIFMPQLKEKYSFIFDLHMYMDDITESTLLDYASIICTEIYNANISNLFDKDDPDSYEMTYADMQKILPALLNALNTARKEALTIYYEAGVPEIQNPEDAYAVYPGEQK